MRLEYVSQSNNSDDQQVNILTHNGRYLLCIWRANFQIFCLRKVVYDFSIWCSALCITNHYQHTGNFSFICLGNLRLRLQIFLKIFNDLFYQSYIHSYVYIRSESSATLYDATRRVSDS